MSPNKPLSMLIDESIERDVDWMIEQDHSEPEQIELFEDHEEN